MKQRLLALYWVFWGVFLLSYLPSNGQTISGVVFRDFDSNGQRAQTQAYSEPGIGGVRVIAYNTASAPVASATTTADGAYSLTTGPGQFRVVFSNFQSGDYVSFKGLNNRTDVQFVAGGATNVDLALNYPAHYCGVPDPALLVPCYVNGDPMNATAVAASEASGNRDVLVSVPYSASGLTPPETMIAKGSEIGAVYGLAMLRSANKLFTAAFTKRHMGFGPGGPGGIYITDLATNTSRLFATIDAGPDPHTGLPASVSVASHDAGAFDAVGKTGLGAIAVSDDGRMLYVMNLFDRRMYLIPIVSAAPAGADPLDFLFPGTITSVPVPTPGCSSYRPFALTFSRGKLYVGLVCSNEDLPVTQNPFTVPSPGNAYVYAFDVATETNLPGGSAQQVLTFPLAYPKGATITGQTDLQKWYAWGNNFYNAIVGVPGRHGDDVAYPQPWLTDLDFDVDGTMILGIRDRFGDQSGYRNLGPNPSDQAEYSGSAVGDILRAGPCGANGTYQLESGGALCGQAPTIAGVNGDGPGGGEFYDDGVYCCHNESSFGGLALLAGRGEVVNVTLDPFQLNTAGFRFFDNKTGLQRREAGYHQSGTQIYRSENVTTFGKANGLGDVELACNAAPIQIGNRVWNDTNANGQQDADETGIASVTLGLYQNNVLIASTQTDATGEYYFGPDNVPSGVKPFTAYEIRIVVGTAPLTDLNASIANLGDDLTDSDGVPVNGNVIARFTTGSYGQNNFSIDFGFNTCPPQKCVPITVTRIKTMSLPAGLRQ